MDQLLRQKLRHHLILDEELRLELYRCTAGKLTIGVGRNIEDNGIRESEALFMLENDMDYHYDWLRSHFDWFDKLNDMRQCAIIMMSFNLGTTRFLSFKKMIAALARHDYKSASEEMLNSKWAEQLPNRSQKLSKMVLYGKEI